MIGTILGNVDVITLGIDVVTDLGSLDVSSDGSNDVKLEGLLPGYSLVYTDGKVIVSYKGVWFSFSFMNSLALLVVFCLYWHIWCLLFCSKIILAKKYYCDGY